MPGHKNRDFNRQARQIVEQLQTLGNAEIAIHSQRFFKTGEGEYGAGDRFLGIRVPIIRKAAKQYRCSSLRTAACLLHSDFHEVRLLALILLVNRYAAQAQERESVYRLYLKNTEFINNWDLVDSSAPQIVGAHLYERERATLDTLSRSRSLWERRIAILATFYFIRRKQYADTLRLVQTLLDDPEDLIHKAAGWMLREIGKRDVEVEIEFLNRHCEFMPRTMLRYAIERLDEPLRQRYLKGEV